MHFIVKTISRKLVCKNFCLVTAAFLAGKIYSQGFLDASKEKCPVHGFEEHGREAEELRAGIEAIVEHVEESYNNATDDDYLEIGRNLQKLLDKVDAADSLSYLERKKK